MIKESTITETFNTQVVIAGLYANNHPGSFRISRYRNGSYDPAWRSKIKEGVSATTPLQAFETSCSVSKGLCTYSLGGSYGARDTDLGMNKFTPSWGNPYPGFWQSSSSLVSKAQASARSRAFQKINSLQNRFAGQEFLGELHQTVGLLRNPFRSSVKLIDSFKNFANAKSLSRLKLSAKSAGDSWLEFRFGLLPLISDIETVIDIINQKQTLEKLSYRYYAKADSVSMLPDVIGSEDVYFNNFGYDKDTAECIIHFGIISDRIHQAETSGKRLLETINNLSSIPSTAWELTPWSFLIDYFVNIGSIIDAATTGQQILSFCSESNIYTQERYLTIGSVNRPAASFILNPVLIAPRHMSFKHRSVDRVGGSLAIPPLVVSLPGSNVRYANIAALLTKLL